MKEIIDEISKKYVLGVVGGGKYDKIKSQLDDRFTKFEHIFAECGCVYYRNGYNIYTKNLRHHETYKYINLLIKEALSFLSSVDYVLTGHFIDLRNGIVYISLIGMDATQEEREYFMNLDKEKHYRKNLLKELKEYSEIYYFGDKYQEGGNDYQIINHKYVNGYGVDSVDMTKKFLRKLL